MSEWTATFTIDMAPAGALLDGTNRLEFSKTWSGDLSGSGRGVML